MLEFDGIVACICEGSAEQAIMELLLENKLLIFNEILDDKIIRTRSASCFEKEYLRKGFAEKLTIVRILDSRRENFKLSELYKEKIAVINVITAPEIEMLIIHNENKYNDFKKSNEKPSDYCKRTLKYSDVKTYRFVRKYFSDVNTLVEAIKIHRQKSRIPKDEKSLVDLLR